MHDLDAMKLNLFVQTTWVKLTTSNFDTLEDFNGIYNKKLLPVPYGQQNWKSDEEFGNQRLSGCNPTLLKRCQQIPEKLAVTEEMIKPFLEGKSLEEALEKKKLYHVDLTYICNIKIAQPEKYELCGPIALFYSNDRGELVPIAIQLMPEPADDNPVFLPSDPEYTWLAAKMWFNLSDSSHHQSVTHIGFTHFYMENVAACAHRQLSPSHPVFKLLAPHFLYLMAINSLGLARLVSVGGWVDTCMTIGVSGMFDIIKANWKEWDWSKTGNILKDFEFRGVDDEQALPNYHFRDDSTLLWHAVYKYASNVINAYYDTKGKLTNDHEIQTWVREISESGMKGIPSSVSTNDELSELVTSFIFTASVGHAAANFCQYDEYAYPPNYPAKLNGKRPRNKEPLTEKYVLDCLASRKETLDVMIVTKLLSERATNELGDFEMQYAYDPIMLKAVDQFKADLKEVGAAIDKRNASRVRKYPYLHPKNVPNAISI